MERANSTSCVEPEDVDDVRKRCGPVGPSTGFIGSRSPSLGRWNVKPLNSLELGVRSSSYVDADELLCFPNCP